MPDEKRVRKMGNLLRGGVSIVLCICALAGGALAFQGLASLKEKPRQRQAEESVLKVDVFVTERIDLRELVFGFGTARAYREVMLSAEVGGRVMERHPKLEVGEQITAETVTVDEQGRTVSTPKSLPLIRIDPGTYQQRVVQAEGRIAEVDAELALLAEQDSNNQLLLKKAKADVEVFQREFERIEDLRKKGVSSKTELTTARLELERYRRGVLSLENERRLFPVQKLQLERRRDTHVADLETARLDLDRTEIRPPFSGVLSEVYVEVGQHLKPGDPIAQLLDLSVIEIPVSLPLADYEKIATILKSGESPIVSLARNETAPAQWTGFIERVSPQVDESTRTVEVYLRVENARQPVPLLPGTFVHARIQGPLTKNALAIPRDCVIRDIVYISQGQRAVPRKLDVSRTLQSLAFIESGLRAGDRVILTNLDALEEGTAIEVQAEKGLAAELNSVQLPLVVPETQTAPAGR